MLRNFMMHGAGLEWQKVPCKPTVLLSLRVADFKFMSTKNWQDMAVYLENKLNVRVRALELAKYSPNDQMYLTSQSTVRSRPDISLAAPR